MWRRLPDDGAGSSRSPPHRQRKGRSGTPGSAAAREDQGNQSEQRRSSTDDETKCGPDGKGDPQAIESNELSDPRKKPANGVDHANERRCRCILQSVKSAQSAVKIAIGSLDESALAAAFRGDEQRRKTFGRFLL
jgi:hypothetical protein